METVVPRTVFDLIAQGSIAATPHRKQGFVDRAIGAACVNRSKESCRLRPVHLARQKGRGGGHHRPAPATIVLPVTKATRRAISSVWQVD